MDIKVCTKCKNEYSASTEYFHRSSTGKFGLSATCKNCYKEYCIKNKEKVFQKNKNYRDNNLDKISQYKKKWSEANQGHVKERSKNYYQENKESILAYQKVYNQINSEHRSNTTRIWRTANRVKWVEFYSKNKEKRLAYRVKWAKSNKLLIRQYSQKRRAKLKELPAHLTNDEWLECVTYFDNKCAYCGEKKELHQDHFIALDKHGEYGKNNIIPSCKNCNSSKHKNDFFIWYPTFKYYSKNRERKIVQYLKYLSVDTQQLSF